MQQNEVEEVEAAITELQKDVLQRDRLKRLESNPDFRAIIEKGYFQDQPIRLVSAMGDPNLAHLRPEFLKQIDAIGALGEYFRMITLQGNTAENEIGQNRDLLTELRLEQAELEIIG